MSKPNFSPPINQPYAITSYFAPRGGVFHDGLDLAPRGNHDFLLRYMTKGRILREGWDNRGGWYVIYEAEIWDNRRWQIEYWHMAHRSPHRAGDRIDVGQWSGTIGSTGSASTGAHVHIRIRPDYGPWYIDPKLAMEQMELIGKVKGPNWGRG